MHRKIKNITITVTERASEMDNVKKTNLSQQALPRPLHKLFLTIVISESAKTYAGTLCFFASHNELETIHFSVYSFYCYTVVINLKEYLFTDMYVRQA